MSPLGIARTAIAFSIPPSVAVHAPVSTFQTLALPSHDPETRLPSGHTDKLRTPPE